MERSTTLLGWMAGGAGIILLYSAYKNEGPISVVRNALTGSHDPTTTISSVANPSSGAVGTTATLTGGGDPAAAGGTKDMSQWVSIPSQPKFKLASVAAASFAQVERDYGKIIPLSGAGRSYAEQVIGYAQAPDRFGLPGTSLHEWGLAVDVSQLKSLMEDEKLIAAFTKNGWFRRGKKGDWYGTGTIPEPWHWSKGVPG